MTETAGRDKWARWLLQGRFAGNVQQQEAVVAQVYPIRDRVLANARLAPGDTLLDVGAGDGLIAFGALPLVGDQGTVILSDISDDLLHIAQTRAEELGVVGQCRFLHASADDLGALDDHSVDVVTTRSVLIFVTAKATAFRECYRVLKPGGRLSIFEPINRFGYEPANRLFGYDATPIQPLADKLRAVYQRAQPPDQDPMFAFDERDLFAMTEAAGFADVHLSYEAHLATNPLRLSWEQLVQTAFNPNAPTLEEAMREALSPAEAAEVTAYLRRRYEAGPAPHRWAWAYLWATKA